VGDLKDNFLFHGTLQQWRIFPYVAAAYALAHFSTTIRHDLTDMQRSIMMKTDLDLQATVGGEIHALSSCTKPLASWLARDGIQECREACGGHGYLAGTSTVTWTGDYLLILF